MKRHSGIRLFLIISILFVFNGQIVFAEPANISDTDLQNIASQLFSNALGVSISGQWFMGWQQGEKSSVEFNEFMLKRGYITIKKQFSENISGRITPDISVDQDGDGMGDIEMRLKYCYLRYKFQNTGLITDPFVEFGLVHRPWIEFEQSINNYRVQGTMYMERNRLITSADYGISFFALLGGELSKNYQKLVNKANPGKYGSISFGVFNGGGYHAIEENLNKTIEGRITVRPLPKHLTGLQFSYHAAVGKGNTSLAPDWTLQSGFVSYENRFLVLTGAYFTGVGNCEGSAIYYNGQTPGGIPETSLDQEGYSGFAEIKLFSQKCSLFGRYDQLKVTTTAQENESNRVIAGMAYHFLPDCKIVLDYDLYQNNTSLDNKDHVFEIVTEVGF